MSYTEATRVSECATTNEVTIGHERLQPPERNEQTEKKEDVLGAVEDVKEAVLGEAPADLEPARIEQHRSGVAVQLEDARPSVRRQEADDRLGLDAEPDEPRVEREVRLIGGDRVLEEHVEHALVLDEFACQRGSRGPRTCAQRLFVALERAVGRLRRAHGGDTSDTAEARPSSSTWRLSPSQSVDASCRNGSAREMSSMPAGPLIGQSMSVIASSGARMSSRSR